MKILKQLGIIFSICWLSTFIEQILPFAFPASVIGMILLLLCLLTKIIKVEQIKDTSDFLLANMTFFFIPVNVGLINYLDILKVNWLPILIICIISTLVTFAATAYAMKLAIWLLRKKRRANP